MTGEKKDPTDWQSFFKRLLDTEEKKHDQDIDYHVFLETQVRLLISEIKGIQNRLDGIGFTLLGLVVFIVVVVIRHALKTQ